MNKHKFLVNVAKHIDRYNEKQKAYSKYLDGCWNSNDLDIFVYTHRNFVCTLTNPVYKIITNNEDVKQEDYNIEVIHIPHMKGVTELSHCLSECYGIYYIWKNCSKKYIGLCHPRSNFVFKDDIPNMDMIFKDYDSVCAMEGSIKSLYRHYVISHDKEDIDDAIEIIKDIYPEYGSTLEKWLNSGWVGNRNMLILKKDDYCEWCEFWWDIIQRFNVMRGFTNDDRVEEYYKAHSKRYRNLYSSRSNGFLVERLMSLYFRHNFKKTLVLPMSKDYNYKSFYI